MPPGLPRRRLDQLRQPASNAIGPGSSAGLFKRIVVYGTAGSGIFAYSPAPGQNNLVFSETQSTSDPYGNQTVPGTTVYQGNVALNLAATGITVYANSSSGQTGTWGMLGTFFLTTPVATSYWYSTIGSVWAAPIFAQEPGTVPPPVVPEVWHTVTPPTGFTGTLRYRLTVEAEVEVQCLLAVASTVAAGAVTLITFPAAYTPAVTSRGGCGYFVNGSPTTIAQLQAIMDMRWSANSAGTFTVQAFPGGATATGVTELDFTVRFPLT